MNIYLYFFDIEYIIVLKQTILKKVDGRRLFGVDLDMSKYWKLRGNINQLDHDGYISMIMKLIDRPGSINIKIYMQ